MSDDYRDMLCALENVGAEFLVVGAHALAAHGIVRGTLDFDIWVRPSPGNAKRVWKGLAEFGASMEGIEPADFEKTDLILQIGVTPNRIDLLTAITGVEFETAWKNRIEVNVLDQTVPVIGRQDLILNRQATNRPIGPAGRRRPAAGPYEGLITWSTMAWGRVERVEHRRWKCRDTERREA